MSFTVEMLQTMTRNARRDEDISNKVRIDEIMKDLISAATMAAAAGESDVVLPILAVNEAIQKGIKTRLLAMNMPSFSIHDGFAETSIMIRW